MGAKTAKTGSKSLGNRIFRRESSPSPPTGGSSTWIHRGRTSPCCVTRRDRTATACLVHEDALVLVEDAVEQGSTFGSCLEVHIVFVVLLFRLDNRNLVLF